MTFRPSPLLLVGLMACGPRLGGPSNPGDTFIALADDFKGYVHWEAFAVQDAPVQGQVHAAGDRTVYLSRPPPHGSSAFPTGTIIVKALPGVGRVFARVKRGGGYNADGSVGWEWFELQHTSLEDVVIVWRGTGPPPGEGYGGDPAECNACHAPFASNDYVATAPLHLSDF